MWEARERVVVALTGGPEGETLIRRASRVAQRSGNGTCSPCMSSLRRADRRLPRGAAQAAALVESLGGTYHQVVGDDVAAALLEFARGVTPRNWSSAPADAHGWARAVRRGIGGQVVADSGEIDVHIVTHAAAGSRGWRLPPLTGALTARRRWMGLALALVGVPA